MGMTLLQLAKLIDVYPNTVQKWEYGWKLPRVDNALALAAALDCPVEVLFYQLYADMDCSQREPSRPPPEKVAGHSRLFIDCGTEAKSRTGVKACGTTVPPSQEHIECVDTSNTTVEVVGIEDGCGLQFLRGAQRLQLPFHIPHA
jgi:DNA-binding XRE family transcriptional regulator